MHVARRNFLIYKKNKRVTLIQSLFRRKQAIKLMKKLTEIKFAVKIQKKIRCVLAKKKFAELRDYHKKLVFIQKLWKLKYQKIIYNLKKIQNFFKKKYVNYF